MIKTNLKYFLFIEPTNKKCNEINDYITEHAELIYSKKKNTPERFKGFHTCVCGEKSSSMNYSVRINGKTLIINSLMVHYLKYHREEVPEHQIDLIKKNFERSKKT